MATQPETDRKPWSRWDDARKEELRKLWADKTLSVEDIADRLGSSRGALYQQATKHGLGTRQSARRQRRSTVEGRQQGGTKEAGSRRFKGFAHDDDTVPRIVLPAHHPAYRDGATIFPSRVFPAGRMPQLLKSGEHGRKIGKMGTKGPWKGKPIFMLTLEERHTCPRTCLEWSHCYGNNMPFAERIHDDGTLERRLWAELAVLQARHPHGFVLRLHILGDFYSVDYVRFWRSALNDFPGLMIFGFTARLPRHGAIGVELVGMARDFGERFRVRFSGGGYDTHCAEVVDRPDQATGILCPAERDAARCCATCGLCGSSDKTITFTRH